MAENFDGELEYPLNLTKFNNTCSVVLGFTTNFGAKKTKIEAICLRGEVLHAKYKVVNTVYEVRANLADHPGV